MKRILLNAIFAACAAAVMPLQAEVTLPQIISDGMIVQRNQPVAVWGKADPGEAVNVKINNAGRGRRYVQTATVTADADGKWLVELPPLPAGGPYSMAVNDKSVEGILSGDVYLCSGQSNMELPIRRVTDMFADEVAEYENWQIRQFDVPNDYDFNTERDDVGPTAWREISQENVMDFSALGYFFAKEMYERSGVPIGIVNSTWGGTPVESWISEESLQPYPRALALKKMYESADYRKSIKKVEGQNYYHWGTVLWQTDPGVNGEVKWFDPHLDDADWQVIDLLSTDWATDGVNPNNGTHWFRRTVVLPEGVEDKPAMLRLGCMVDADSTFVNGKFAGNITYQYPPRKYELPAGMLHPGENVIAVRLFSQAGFPQFVPEKPYKLIVDGEEYSLEGDWRYHRGAAMPQGPDMMFFYRYPVVLYNAMIHPLLNYKFAGTVWYQGESNVDRWNEYAEYLKTMMADWRKNFNAPDMPFYIVELANYMAEDCVQPRAMWAALRQQQAQAVAEMPNAYLVPNSDLGEWNDIHPLDKKTLARRVADLVAGKR